MRLQMAVGCLLATSLLATAGCKSPGSHNLPPAHLLAHPGPGVDGPGPGVMLAGLPDGAFQLAPGATPSTQFAFVGPDGMVVTWDVSAPGLFDSAPLVVPGRQNFLQGAIYRIKLTNVPGRPGVELYPTLEVGPATPRTDAYLAHNAVPIQFTEEDLDQVLTGNFVTKVIYLPDPEFQELALAGVETLVSTRLDPGVDPIVEADRRGAILAIVRLGNKDLQMPGGNPGGEMVVPASHMDEMGYGPQMGHGPAMGMPGMHGGPMGMPGMHGGPMGMPTAGFAPTPLAPHQMAAVTGPQWGMPMSGTPIGLPGPPHIPLGHPAGLQKHVIKNHTHVHMPEPTKQFKVNVKQKPGFTYPKPVNRVWVRESVVAPRTPMWKPLWNKKTHVEDTSHDFAPHH